MSSKRKFGPLGAWNLLISLNVSNTLPNKKQGSPCYNMVISCIRISTH